MGDGHRQPLKSIRLQQARQITPSVSKEVRSV
jgi:hypothetical protein